jgi:hypothetical protein
MIETPTVFLVVILATGQVPPSGIGPKAGLLLMGISSDGLDSRPFSRIELPSFVNNASCLDEAWTIRMMSNTAPSESLAWWGRAAQARRIATMLSPQDAQLAEAYAVECEDRARRGFSDSVPRGNAPTGRTVVDPVFKSAGKASPRRAA